MVRPAHLLYLGAAAGFTLAGALLALLLLRSDPLGHIEPANAQPGGGGMAQDLVAVTLNEDANRQYLCVIARTRGKSWIRGDAPAAGGGGGTGPWRDEWSMVVYEVKNGLLNIKAMRPIEYDLRSRKVFGNEREISEPKPDRKLTPQVLADELDEK